MQASLIQIVADPSRFQIIEALRTGEMAVNDLVAKMEIHQSGVSRHLRILEEAGFVQMRPDGAKRLYSLRPGPFHALNACLCRNRGEQVPRVRRWVDASSQEPAIEDKHRCQQKEKRSEQRVADGERRSRAPFGERGASGCDHPPEDQSRKEVQSCTDTRDAECFDRDNQKRRQRAMRIEAEDTTRGHAGSLTSQCH